MIIYCALLTIISFYLGERHAKQQNVQQRFHNSLRKLMKHDPSIIDKIEKDWEQYIYHLQIAAESLNKLENKLKEIKVDYEH